MKRKSSNPDTPKLRNVRTADLKKLSPQDLTLLALATLLDANGTYTDADLSTEIKRRVRRALAKASKLRE